MELHSNNKISINDDKRFGFFGNEPKSSHISVIFIIRMQKKKEYVVAMTDASPCDLPSRLFIFAFFLWMLQNSLAAAAIANHFYMPAFDFWIYN